MSHNQGEFQLVPTSSSSEGAISSNHRRSHVIEGVRVCQRPAADGASAPSSLIIRQLGFKRAKAFTSDLA